MLDIKTRTVGDVTVLDLTGTLVAGLGLESLNQRIGQLVAAGQLKVVLNAQGVSIIDSSGVGDLVGSFTRLKKAGGSLKVAGPTKFVRDVLHIARIPTIIEVFDTEAAAVEAFTR